MKQRGTFSIQRLALVGMMAAMVFALTYVGIDIPTGLGKTKIHFGNIMCLLSAFLLGPVGGGLAAGVGSALFDLMDPMWAPECWITFLNKFVMAFVAGGVMRKASFLAPRVRVWTAALFVFIVFYLLGQIQWLSFVYALPVSLTVLLVMNSVWGKRKANLYIISALNWSLLATVYLSVWRRNWWILFLLGIPAQIITCLSFRIRPKPQRKKE